MIKLGDVVQDSITLFSGVAVSRTEWLNGCVRIGLQSRDLHDAKPQEVQHIDEVQLVIVSAVDSDVMRASHHNEGRTVRAVGAAPAGPQQDDKRRGL